MIRPRFFERLPFWRTHYVLPDGGQRRFDSPCATLGDHLALFRAQVVGRLPVGVGLLHEPEHELRWGMG